MKSKLLLTSLSALFVSVAGANAAEYHPFVGATMGLQEILYSNEYDDLSRNGGYDLPEDFLSFGITGGVRVGEHNKIYNWGISVNADITSKSEIEDKFSDAKFADIHTFNMSATYDHYLRLSGDKLRRIDLVLGAGLGTMKYDVDAESSFGDDESIWSPELALKIGVDFELTKHLTLSGETRIFVPTRSHYAAESLYVFGGAIKYIF